MKRDRHFANISAPAGYQVQCIMCEKIIIGAENIYVDINSFSGKSSKPHCFECAVKKDKYLGLRKADK